MSKTDTTWEFVKWGMVEEDWFDQVMAPVVNYLRSFALVARSEYFSQHPKLLETYLTMTLQFISWASCLKP